MEHDTIAAIATPVGSGGIGIVRISGPNAIIIFKELFLPYRHGILNGSKKKIDDMQSHRLYYGYIHDPIEKGIVDEVMTVLMKSPRSYTREDVVEIQSHSGPVILSKILHLVLDSGCRLADPGEFTKRAFLNGRIDLSQAEAIADMISAKTQASLKLAATHLAGGLKSKVQYFIDIITRIQVELEAAIEFPDEVGDTVDRNQSVQILDQEILNPIKDLLQQYDDGHILREGIRLDIVGRPNVGKSSLLNAILQKDKAIVTHLPGTTRDLIEDYINIDGIPIILTDTAGLHNTDDPIEKIGIKKTKSNIQKSDLVLWVVDASCGVTAEDRVVFEQISKQKSLLVVNKIDLGDVNTELFVPDLFKDMDSVFVSAKYGQGLLKLKKTIRNKCMGEMMIAPGTSLVPNIRQQSALLNAATSITQSIAGLSGHISEELIVSDLVDAKSALEIITGENVGSDILDEIFGKFCIGK